MSCTNSFRPASNLCLQHHCSARIRPITQTYVFTTQTHHDTQHIAVSFGIALPTSSEGVQSLKTTIFPRLTTLCKIRNPDQKSKRLDWKRVCVALIFPHRKPVRLRSPSGKVFETTSFLNAVNWQQISLLQLEN